MTHICIKNLTIIGSDNGLSPDRRQAIIWTNDGILSIGPSGTNFSEIVIKINPFSFYKMYRKRSSGKWRPSSFGFNVLTLFAVRSKTKAESKYCKNELYGSYSRILGDISHLSSTFPHSSYANTVFCTWRFHSYKRLYLGRLKKRASYKGMTGWL